MNEKARKARNAYMREYRRANKEHINELHKVWRQNNKDKVHEYKERYWSKKSLAEEVSQ
jgi:hypothetical protein